MQTLKILFLGANPRDTTRIRIDEELREIDAQLRLSIGRDRLSLGQKWAVRADDLQQSLVDGEPQIVHFSGHGSTAGICLEDEQGNSKEVNAEALSDLFAIFKGTVKCVLLNACYSETQAISINQYVPYVIGMSNAMPDEAATRFSIGFYKAIAAGKTVEFAFNLGVNAIKLEGLEYEQLPKLLKTSDNLVLLQNLSPSSDTQNTKTVEEQAIKKNWWIYGSVGVAGIVLAAFLGYMFGENKSKEGLQYRISNASMDIYEKSIDSFKLTFDVVADNNSLKTCDFIRDSFSLLLPNSDIVLKPLHEGRSRVSVKRNENIDLKIAFTIPVTTLSGSLSLNIGRPNGTAHIDYLYGAPIASNDKSKSSPITDEGKNDDTSQIPTDKKSTPPSNDVKRAPNKSTGTKTKPVKSTDKSTSSTNVKTEETVTSPQPTANTEPVVIIPKDETGQAHTRMNGGVIKCDPKIIQRMKPLEKMQYEQEVIERRKENQQVIDREKFRKPIR